MTRRLSKIILGIAALTMSLGLGTNAHAGAVVIARTCATLPANYDIPPADLNLTVAEGDQFAVTNVDIVVGFGVRVRDNLNAIAADVANGGSYSTVITAGQAGVWSFSENAVGESRLTCIVGGSQAAGSGFMAEEIINHVIDSTGNAISQRFGNGGGNTAGASDNSANAYFSTAGSNQPAVLSALDGISEADLGPTDPINIWTSGRATWFSGNSAFTGWLGSILVGADALVHPDVVLGGFIGAENGNFSLPPTSTFTGFGATVGAYAGVRIMQNIVLEATLADTWLAYTTGGLAGTGNFNANRIIATLGLTGDYALTDQIRITPTLHGAYRYEYQTAHTTSNAFAIAAREITTGRITFGSTLYYTLDPDNLDMQTRLSLMLLGDYDMSSSTLNNLFPYFNTGLSGRVGLGVDTTLANGANFSLSGEVGGIGNTLQSYIVAAKASVPIN